MRQTINQPEDNCNVNDIRSRENAIHNVTAYSGVARVVVLGDKTRAPKARGLLGGGGVGHSPPDNFEILVPANAISCISWVRLCRKNFNF